MMWAVLQHPALAYPMDDGLDRAREDVLHAGPFGVAPTAGPAGVPVAAPSRGTAHMGHSGSSAGLGPIPTPPQQPITAATNAATQQPLASTPDNTHPSFVDNLTSGPSGALIAAGLATMAGNSPHALQNIGQGGLAGLNHAQQERVWQAANALKQQQEVWNRQHQEAMEQNNANRTDLYGQRIQSMTALDQAKSARLMASAAMAGASKVTPAELNATAIKSLVGTPNPDTGQNWTLPEASRYMNGFDIKERNAANAEAKTAQTGDLGAQRNDIARQNIALKQQELGRKLTKDEVDEILHASSITKNQLTGGLGQTPAQAQPGVQKLRSAAAPAQPAIDPDAIAQLRAHPETAGAFQAHFGVDPRQYLTAP